MKNAAGTIIYVGKAINLKNQVRSYFHADASHDNKTHRLVRIVVGSHPLLLRVILSTIEGIPQ